MAGPSGIASYSPTPATNATASGGNSNWAENQPPSSVNNSVRQDHADLRTAFNDLIWFSYGSGDQAPGVTFLGVPYVYVAANQVTVAGVDVTIPHHIGRRMKFVGPLTGTVYGTISASVFGVNTTITLTMDGAAVLQNEPLTGYLSQIPITGSPVAAGSSFNMQGNVPIFFINSIGSGPTLIGQEANGTLAAPTATALSDFLLYLGGRGHGASAYGGADRAAIGYIAAENWTNAAQGTAIQFFTTPTGGVATTLAATLTNGGLGIVGPGGTPFGAAYSLDIRGSAGGLIAGSISNGSNAVGAQAAFFAQNDKGNQISLGTIGSGWSGLGPLVGGDTYVNATSTANVAINSTGGTIFFTHSGAFTQAAVFAPTGLALVGNPAGTSETTASFIIGDQTGVQKQQLYAGINQANGYAYLGSVFSHYTYTPLILQPNGGRVGIGNTNPQYAVHATSDALGQAAVYLVNPDTANSGGAQANFVAQCGGSSIQMTQYGAHFANSPPVSRTNGALIYTNGAGGLTLASAANAPVYILSNSNEIGRFSDPGLLSMTNANAAGWAGVGFTPAGGSVSYILETGGSFASSGVNRPDQLQVQGNGGYGLLLTVSNANAPITFATNSTHCAWFDPQQCLTLNYNGAYGVARLFVNGGAIASHLAVRIDTATSGDNNIITYQPGTALQYALLLNNANASIGGITTQNSTVSFVNLSDGRLKKNIADADDAGALIDAMRVRAFDFIAGDEHIGFAFVAQELHDVLHQVIPHAVAKGSDVGPEGPRHDQFEIPPGYGIDPMPFPEAFVPWMTDNSKLVPLLVKEIQSLRRRVAATERTMH